MLGGMRFASACRFSMREILFDAAADELGMAYADAELPAPDADSESFIIADCTLADYWGR